MLRLFLRGTRSRRGGGELAPFFLDHIPPDRRDVRPADILIARMPPRQFQVAKVLADLIPEVWMNAGLSLKHACFLSAALMAAVVAQPETGLAQGFVLNGNSL